MAGTPHGLVDCTSGDTYLNSANTMFIMIWNFWQVMISAGYAELIASNYGNGGTGFDFRDEANPCGENAWFCVKMKSSAERPGGATLGEYYVLTQWAYNDAFGAAPGNPGLLGGGTGNGVGIAVAFRTDGGNPWGGTTGSPGSDSKGTPVWIDGGSQVIVVDPSCEAGIGSFGTNKENTLNYFSAGAGSVGRVHMVGDEDYFYLISDTFDNNGYDRLFECSSFKPFANYPCSYPLMVRCQYSGTIPLVGQWHGSSGGGGTYSGGIVGPNDDGNKACRVYSLRMPGEWDTSVQWSPNKLYPVPTWNEHPHILMCYDYQHGGGYNYAISGSWLGEVYNVPWEGVNADLSKTFMNSNSNPLEIRYSCAWNGTLPPGFRGGRDGYVI